MFDKLIQKYGKEAVISFVMFLGLEIIVALYLVGWVGDSKAKGHSITPPPSTASPE